MKQLIHLLTIAALAIAAACASQRAKPSPPQLPAQFAGAPSRITQVNDQFHFVVIDFSGRTLPVAGTRVSVYRGEQRVGTVEITEPVRSHFATADILEGDLQVGDEAR